MQAGARGEAPRVAQELGIANVNVMQAGARDAAPRVAQELGIAKIYTTKLYIAKTLYHNILYHFKKNFGVYAWE